MRNLCSIFVLLMGCAATANELRDSRPGDIVTLDALVLPDVPRFDVEIKPADGPQLLFSDMPEYFRTGDGVAMEEEVRPGVVRLYVYHVPEPTGEKKVISAVIENLSDEPMTFRFLRYSFPNPGGDYHKIGKEGLMGYFTSSPRDELRTIPSRGRAPIDPEMDRAVVTKDMLVHGLYEFEINQPARVTVFQRDPNVKSIEVIDTLPRLDRVLLNRPSGAGRGLFPICNKDVTGSYDTARGRMQVVVADGVTDTWIEGRDTITGIVAPNKGNYGVMYRLRLQYSSSDGRALAVLLTSDREGPWCRATAAAVVVNDGNHSGGAIPLPKNQVRFERFPQAVVIQTFPPAPRGQTRTIEILYSPPGASCLPTPLLLVPYDP